MPLTHYCPYWKWDEKLKAHCEMAVLKFPACNTQSEFCKTYCASQNGWKDCSIAQALNKYYEEQA